MTMLHLAVIFLFSALSRALVQCSSHRARVVLSWTDYLRRVAPTGVFLWGGPGRRRAAWEAIGRERKEVFWPKAQAPLSLPHPRSLTPLCLPSPPHTCPMCTLQLPASPTHTTQKPQCSGSLVVPLTLNMHTELCFQAWREW